MKTKILFGILIIIIMMSTTVQATEQKYDFEGEYLTGNIFVQMRPGFNTGADVLWNGERITEARGAHVVWCGSRKVAYRMYRDFVKQYCLKSYSRILKLDETLS